MISYDPMIANATPRGLIQMVDAKQDATQLEKALADALLSALEELRK